MQLTVGEDEAGQRLDAFLASRLPQFSRSFLRRVIDAGGVLLDDRKVKAGHKVGAGESVSVTIIEPPREGPIAEDIPLDVLYEDDCLAAVNKPPGMVVHPAKGHWSGTLASAAAFRFGSLSGVGGPTRPGIVHRLDRDTSGVIIVAKTDAAHAHLAEQFANRTVEKQYLAIVAPAPDRDRDYIEAPIGPHPHHREKMAVRRRHPEAREATTFYEVLERFHGFSVVRAWPKTGRTHQIRVHLASIGCPVLCDRLYGGRATISKQELLQTPAEEASAAILDRQALHAQRLKLDHPQSGDRVEFEAPLAEDLEKVIQVLQQNVS